MRTSSPILWTVLALAPACMPAHAAISCVASASGLQSALDQAETNGEADFVKLRAGSIALDASIEYLTDSPTADHLPVFVRGGYNTDCSQRTGYTTLDGQDQVRPLMLRLHGADFVSIDHLMLMRGNASTYSTMGGNMAIYLFDQSGGGEVQLDAMRFVLGSAGSGGGLMVTGWGAFRLRNSLLAANESDGTAALSINLDGSARVVNTTITDNVKHGSPGNAVYAFATAAGSTIEFSNSIIWDNENVAWDLYMADSSRMRLSHNDIGTRSPIPAEYETGALSVDPGFASCGLLCFDRVLAADSPLTDAGDDEAPGGIDTRDLRDAPRIGGAHVDIGAYERDRLFDDGFEPGGIFD